MTTWIFEPGHTEAAFRARHMMVTWVRGLFQDIHGQLEFDLDDCLAATFSGEIDATKAWTGEPDRDLGDLEQTGAISYYRQADPSAQAG